MPLPARPITLATDGRHPWEQQPGEGDTRYKQFIQYRDLGPGRTLPKVRERFDKPVTHASAREYCRRFHWESRARAYDAYIEDQWVLALREHTKQMVQRHLRLGEKLRQLVDQRLDTLKPETLTPTELYRLTELYSKLTRVALGEPDTHVAVTGKHGAPPVQITSIPGSENARAEQMRAATIELAQRLGMEPYDLDAESILELPE
jgi:hypothetical protein